jgi:uncharacterized protein (DUF58 family)
MKQIRPTTGGIALLVGIVVLAVAGFWASYREFLLLAGVGLALLVLAFVLPRFATNVTTSRRLTRVLVQRGENIDMKLTITAETAMPSLSMTDQVGSSKVSFEVPALAADEQREVAYQVKADRRGVHKVGPIREERRDPFDLSVRTSNHDLIDQVLVHPVVHKLGRTENSALLLQRNTPFRSITDDPSSEFRTLREYQPGDDPRLIHWPSSARTGELVIRDFLDLRRLARVVALETNEAVLSGAEFEEAAEIACSVAVQALDSGLITIVRSTDPASPTAWAPMQSRTAILTTFAQVERSPAATTRNDRMTASGGLPAGQVYLITGARSQLLPRLLGGAEMRAKLVVVRVSSQPGRLPRLPVATIDVRSGIDFARKWRRGNAA